jgi:hypothetical protein
VPSSEGLPSDGDGEATEPVRAGRVAQLGKTVALYSSLGAAALFGVAKFTELRIRNEISGVYGSIEEPRFRLLQGNSPDVVRSLDALIAERVSAPQRIPFDSAVGEALLSDFKSTLTELEEIVKRYAPSEAERHRLRARCHADKSDVPLQRLEFEERYGEFAAGCEALEALCEAAELNAIKLERVALSHDIDDSIAVAGLPTTLESPESGVGAPGPISSVEYAKAIFREVTGRELPPAVTIERCDIEDFGVAGTAETIGQRIVVEPASFAQEVSTLCHEMGHLVARPGEDAVVKYGLTGVLLRGARDSRVAEVLEEASAYAFERVCLAAIPDEQVRSAAVRSFEGQLLTQAKLFFRGNEDIHFEATVVADAAVLVLGDPKRAYDYLSTTREFSPEIVREVERMRGLCESLPASRYRRAAKEFLEAGSRAEALRTDYDPFVER